MSHEETLCPEAPELLDHLEGRLDLGGHLEGCLACRETVAELSQVAAAEAAAFRVPSPLEVERALANVRGRGARNRRRKWLGTALVSAVAAVALAAAMPGTFVGPADGPRGGGGPTGAFTTPTLDVDAPPMKIVPPSFTDRRMKDLVEDLASPSSQIGVVRSDFPAPAKAATAK